jgi:hypothetical protein
MFSGAFCLELGERFSIAGAYGLVSPAEATVGRPLTPVSVAGVIGGPHGAISSCFAQLGPGQYRSGCVQFVAPASSTLNQFLWRDRRTELHKPPRIARGP